MTTTRTTTSTAASASALRALALLVLAVVAVRAELVHVDLAAAEQGWTLSNANGSISLPTRVPAHTLAVLADAGLVAADPLFRYGEREARWVADERGWNFTRVWSSQQHAVLTGCRHVCLVLHGLDTFGSVVLNGRHVLEAHNAHRSWWLPLNSSRALREGANLLSVVLRPAAEAAAAAQAAYPYPVPTMQVPGGAGPYNFARKPAFDFGWDWGPAFVPAGISGGVELVGFDRATLIGALVTQQFNSSSQTFSLTVTAHFVVPPAGDSGTLEVTLAALDMSMQQQVQLQPAVVGGNKQQALASMSLDVPASRVTLWQPLTLQPKGTPRQLYDVAVMFTPDDDGGGSSTCGAAGGGGGGDSSSSSSSSDGSVAGAMAVVSKDDPYILTSTIVRRVGFRSVELVQEPLPAAAPAEVQEGGQRQQDAGQQRQHTSLNAAAARGESFFFRVNGVPLFAKGANLIPLHVLSTAVGPADVRALLQAAVDSNMNMVRIWGGGIYQIDELYDAADELGLLVWQEAMLSCSPYPRHGAFLADVEAEVTQQLLRLGSHASLAVLGGNNEVEQSLEWFNETRANPALYAIDYAALFLDTIGSVVQQLLPGTAWVDSSPSKGSLWLPQHTNIAAAPVLGDEQPDQAADATAEAAAAVRVKRWGNTNDPAFGDAHFYNYRDDCQDWRTYPSARFVSEYGWQSYPAWSTFASATAPEDWSLRADMTEFRQRHPNGTLELLVQLQRRFQLPQAWRDLLPQQQQQQQQDSRQAAGAHPLQHSTHAEAGWRAAAQRLLVLLLPRSFAPLWQRLDWQNPASGSSSSASHVRRPASGLAVGRAASQPRCAFPSSSRVDSAGRAVCEDMQHFVYLTQLQQMLCYETALQQWRRLRSEDAASLRSSGVLYWQLNDVWAGASWSGMDYAGVWKPVQFSIARAFADVTLNVQHDLDDNSITVHAVNDLQQKQRVKLLVRLLALADTPGVCGAATANVTSVSNRADGASALARASADYAKYTHSMSADVAPAAAARLWSKSAQQLLAMAGSSCTANSCYVHLVLSAKGHPDQEATVWLAAFRDLQLQDPGLNVSGFNLADAGVAHQHGAVAFNVSSQAVAAFAVWDTSPGPQPPGHFSHNALTIHPCEPREVVFVPRPSGAAAASRSAAAQAAASSRRFGSKLGTGDVVRGRPLLALLQEQLAVSSLWDHSQQPEPQPTVAAA